MGMYDEVRCEAPLPDGYDGSATWFQTKSFPDPIMCRFVITRGGRLLDRNGSDWEPDGYVSFYTTDRDPSVAAEGADMDPLSSSGAPRYRWREYRARFRSGQLEEIVRVEEKEVASLRYGLACFRWFHAPTEMFGDADE